MQPQALEVVTQAMFPWVVDFDGPKFNRCCRAGARRARRLALHVLIEFSRASPPSLSAAHAGTQYSSQCTRLESVVKAIYAGVLGWGSSVFHMRREPFSRPRCAPPPTYAPRTGFAHVAILVSTIFLSAL